jgi:threonine/homoserine/homoserine lactone efflux protein
MDLQVIDYFGKGTLLGLAAGFSPGPLTVLVIGETLRHGLRSGLQVAIAPILTDIPVILLSRYVPRVSVRAAAGLRGSCVKTPDRRRASRLWG